MSNKSVPHTEGLVTAQNNHNDSDQDKESEYIDLKPQIQEIKSQHNKDGETTINSVNTNNVVETINDSFIRKVTNSENFCYRIGCTAVMISKDVDYKPIKLSNEKTEPVIFQPPLDESLVYHNFPKSCKIDINVFRHHDAPKPKEEDPKDWEAIPIVMSKFDHCGGDLIM